GADGATEPIQPVEPVEPAPVIVANVQVSHGDEDTTLSAGDTVTVTYTGELDLATALAGWSGDATAATVRLRDGSGLDVLVDGAPVALGEIVLPEGYLVDDQEIAATMTAGTVDVGGVACTVITLE